jgi:DNA polymerase
MKKVYDIKNAGHRNRFMVRGKAGVSFIVSNCTQGLARDIFAWMMRDVHQAGFKIVMTTHDEIVTEVRAEDGEHAKEVLEKQMSIAPPWIPDIPLGAEAEVMPHHYKK